MARRVLRRRPRQIALKQRHVIDPPMDRDGAHSGHPIAQSSCDVAHTHAGDRQMRSERSTLESESGAGKTLAELGVDVSQADAPGRHRHPDYTRRTASRGHFCCAKRNLERIDRNRQTERVNEAVELRCVNLAEKVHGQVREIDGDGTKRRDVLAGRTFEGRASRGDLPPRFGVR